MRYEDFDPSVYEQLSDEDKLKLVGQIAKSLREQIDDKLWDIDDLQSQIEDLEFDVENIRGQRQPFLEERKRLRIALGLKPAPGHLHLFTKIEAAEVAATALPVVLAAWDCSMPLFR